jgi:hypothetical protein
MKAEVIKIIDGTYRAKFVMNYETVTLGRIFLTESEAQKYADQFNTALDQHVQSQLAEKDAIITAKNETIDSLIDALKELCDLKDYKENVGKDAGYMKRQPEAWKQAFGLLNTLIGYGEPNDGEAWSGGIADNH